LLGSPKYRSIPLSRKIELNVTMFGNRDVSGRKSYRMSASRFSASRLAAVRRLPRDRWPAMPVHLPSITKAKRKRESAGAPAHMDPCEESFQSRSRSAVTAGTKLPHALDVVPPPRYPLAPLHVSALAANDAVLPLRTAEQLVSPKIDNLCLVLIRSLIRHGLTACRIGTPASDRPISALG